MGKQLTYRIPARYRVVLVERLGGLFFDGRRSCTEDSFLVVRIYIATSLSWWVYLFERGCACFQKCCKVYIARAAINESACEDSHTEHTSAAVSTFI